MNAGSLVITRLEQLELLDDDFTSDAASDVLQKEMQLEVATDQLKRGPRLNPGEARCWEYSLEMKGANAGTLQISDDGPIYYQPPAYAIHPVKAPNMVSSLDLIIEFLQEEGLERKENRSFQQKMLFFWPCFSIIFALIAYLSSHDWFVTGLVASVTIICWMPLLIWSAHDDKQALANIEPWID